MQADPTLDVNLTRALEESAAARRLDQARHRSLGHHRRRQRRSRRDGGVSARDGRRQSAAARSRPDDRREDRVPDDGVAVRLDAPQSAAAGRTPGGDCGIQLPRSAVRERSRVREIDESGVVRGQPVHAQLGRGRTAASDDRDAVRLGALAHSRRQDELLGPRRAAIRSAAVQRGQPRRVRRRLADFVRRRQAVLRQGRRAAWLLGHEGRARAGARWCVSAPVQAELRRGGVQTGHREDGAPLHSRAARASPPTAC